MDRCHLVVYYGSPDCLICLPRLLIPLLATALRPRVVTHRCGSAAVPVAITTSYRSLERPGDVYTLCCTTIFTLPPLVTAELRLVTSTTA
ncbi:hypothetical protein J6590_047268 [Homalodisca vitripennis]|nr:hypothetical protein J6590_047268 [Homalodisca vitripennis]